LAWPLRLHVLAELSVRHRLTAITLFPDFARLGGLLAYGPNLLGMWRLVGVVSGKVLRGAAPATHPIERPTKFELVLNLKTAGILDLAIPAPLLLRADEVMDQAAFAVCSHGAGPDSERAC
jgi:putative ABC transport system substrate-binding protein